MWPLVVAVDCTKCCWTALTDKSGHPRKKPFLIADNQVVLLGEKHIA